MKNITSFGKFCRKLRIDNNEILYDMAQKLEVSTAFLSQVENGKKKPPKEWEQKIAALYPLTADEKQELNECIFEAINHDSIDLSYFNESERQMMLSFARRLRGIEKKEWRNGMNELFRSTAEQEED